MNKMYLRDRILLGCKKKRSIDPWYNVNEPWKHYANWKKPNAKDLISCESNSPGGAVEKNSPANAGHTGDGDTQVQSLGQEDPLEEEMATHHNILDWEILGTEEPGGLQSMGP